MFQVLGGVAFGIATAETGVGAVVGAAVTLKDLDNVQPGLRQFYFGEVTDTATKTIATALAGGDERIGTIVDVGTDLLGVFANPANAARGFAVGTSTVVNGAGRRIAATAALRGGFAVSRQGVGWLQTAGRAGSLVNAAIHGKIGGGLLAAAAAGDDNQPSQLNGNSLDYVGDTHVYRIKGPNGTVKIGESMQGVRKRDAASIRGEGQARRLTRQTDQPFRSDIRRTFGDKRSAREYERRLIERFRRMFGNDSLPGNYNSR